MGSLDDEINTLNQRITGFADPSPAPEATTAADSGCGCDGNPIKSTEDTTNQTGEDQPGGIVGDVFDVEMTDREPQTGSGRPSPEADCPPFEERTLPVEIELVRRINTLRKRVYDSQKELCSADSALLMMHSLTRSYIPYFALSEEQVYHMIDHLTKIVNKDHVCRIWLIYDTEDAIPRRYQEVEGFVFQHIVVKDNHSKRFLWDKGGVVARSICYKATLFANAPLSDTEIDGILDLGKYEDDYGGGLDADGIDAYVQRHLSAYSIRPYVIMLYNIALLHMTALDYISDDVHKHALNYKGDFSEKTGDLEHREQLLSSGYIRRADKEDGEDRIRFTIDVEQYSINIYDIIELLHLHAPTKEETFSMQCMLYGREIVREFQSYIQKTQPAEHKGDEMAIVCPMRYNPLKEAGMSLDLSLYEIDLAIATYMPQSFTRVYN